MFRLHAKRFVVGWAALASGLSCCPKLVAAESVEGRVTQVTLYRGLAQLTRTSPIEVRTRGLSSTTIRWSTTDNLSSRCPRASSRYRTNLSGCNASGRSGKGMQCIGPCIAWPVACVTLARQILS
jgi:hypothetical protein